jgi:hypothetical protein
MIASATFSLISLKAVSCSSSHANLMSFFVSLVMGFISAARPGMWFLIKLQTPKKRLMSLMFVGAKMARTALTPLADIFLELKQSQEI